MLGRNLLLIYVDEIKFSFSLDGCGQTLLWTMLLDSTSCNALRYIWIYLQFLHFNVEFCIKIWRTTSSGVTHRLAIQYTGEICAILNDGAAEAIQFFSISALNFLWRIDIFRPHASFSIAQIYGRAIAFCEF